MPFKCLATGCRSTFDKGTQLYQHCLNVNHPFRFPCTSCCRCFTNESGRRSHFKSKLHAIIPTGTQSVSAQTENQDTTDVDNTSLRSFSIIDQDDSLSTASYDIVSDLSSSIDMSIISLSTSQHDSDMQPTVSYVDITDADSTQAFCMKCLHHFDTIHDLLQHYADSKNHNWCFACSKDFESAKRLRKHYRSIVHLPKNLQCPLCTKKFKYPSAVADHIESGKHKLTRKQVTFAVHSLGVIPTISVEGRIQQGTDISTLPSMPKLVANPSAFDGQSYRCHLPQCERTFRTLLSLEKHLNSAAHDEDEFKCPNPECDRAFKLVSGLIRHVESETCSLTNVKEVTDRFMAMTAQFTKLILSGSESS